MTRYPLGSLFVALALLSTAAFADIPCKARGDLDTTYCDENGDLTADLPADAA